MKLQHDTIAEFSKILVRLGEASIVGSVASIFIQGIRFSISILGFAIGTLLIFTGLFFYNYSKEKIL
jgi:hypothetical protein